MDDCPVHMGEETIGLLRDARVRGRTWSPHTTQIFPQFDISLFEVVKPRAGEVTSRWWSEDGQFLVWDWLHVQANNDWNKHLESFESDLKTWEFDLKTKNWEELVDVGQSDPWTFPWENSRTGGKEQDLDALTKQKKWEWSLWLEKSWDIVTVQEAQRGRFSVSHRIILDCSDQLIFNISDNTKCLFRELKFSCLLLR
jgi:hypothetical protein